MTTLALFQQIRAPEILIILAVVLLLFGTKKLPEIGRSLGRGLKEFKSGVKGFGDDVRDGLGEDDDDERAAPGRSAGPAANGSADRASRNRPDR